MVVLNWRGRLGSVAIVAFTLAACAADPDPEANGASEETPAAEVSSPLVLAPLSAFSETNASFAGLGIGAVSTVGTTGTIGTSVGVGGGLGAGGFNTSFGTGPTGFNTGPITMSSGYNSGPVTMTSGGGTSISSGTGSAPVITTTCAGIACP